MQTVETEVLLTLDNGWRPSSLSFCRSDNMYTRFYTIFNSAMICEVVVHGTDVVSTLFAFGKTLHEVGDRGDDAGVGAFVVIRNHLPYEFGCGVTNCEEFEAGTDWFTLHSVGVSTVTFET